MLTEKCMAAADYILEKTENYNCICSAEEKIFMTCARLQKLLYFSEVEYMKRNEGRPMFLDDFYAWPSGPVIPSVYHEYLQEGREYPVAKKARDLPRMMKDALDFILEKTWCVDVKELIELSRADGGPWRRFYCNDDCKHSQVVPKCEIFAHYRKNTTFA